MWRLTCYVTVHRIYHCHIFNYFKIIYVSYNFFFEYKGCYCYELYTLPQKFISNIVDRNKFTEISQDILENIW